MSEIPSIGYCIYSQTISSDTSVRINSSRAGLCTPHTERDAGCIRSSNSGLRGTNAGVPWGYIEVA